jgi:hypothetical protein
MKLAALRAKFNGAIEEAHTVSRRSFIDAGFDADAHPISAMHFDTPYKGFVTAAVMAYQEWQHDGFASTFPVQPDPNPSGNVDFNTTWAVELNYNSATGRLAVQV